MEKFNGVMIHVDAINYEEAIKQCREIIKELNKGEIKYKVLTFIKPIDNIMVDAYTVILKEVK